MCVDIQEVQHDQVYNVNDKEVYRDNNNNWIAREELTPQEGKSFGQYRKAKGLS